MIQNFEHRIHVNGIRGKSSVTRLISASLREGKVKTLGKTTGTAARLLINHRKDAIIPRKEADIAEQKRIIDAHKNSGYGAIVFECMAINPIYQKYLENKIMLSTIGVITNVREDHTDLLGTTLPQIARSLCSTVPKNGHLITAETNPELLAIIAEECALRNTKLHAVGNMKIADKRMAAFKHFEYKANVAIAIKAAQIVGVKRATALAGMQKAIADPGAFVLKNLSRKNKKIHWANLFAINDRESFILTAETLNANVGGAPKKAVILNNRHDRPERVAQFVDIAINSVNADYIITFGDYEKQVIKMVLKHDSQNNVQVIQLGNSSAFKNATGRQLLDKITQEIAEREFILYGAVNIHTQQSQSFLNLMEKNYAH